MKRLELYEYFREQLLKALRQTGITLNVDAYFENFFDMLTDENTMAFMKNATTKDVYEFVQLYVERYHPNVLDDNYIYSPYDPSHRVTIWLDGEILTASYTDSSLSSSVLSKGELVDYAIDVLGTIAYARDMLTWRDIVTSYGIDEMHHTSLLDFMVRNKLVYVINVPVPDNVSLEFRLESCVYLPSEIKRLYERYDGKWQGALRAALN